MPGACNSAAALSIEASGLRIAAHEAVLAHLAAQPAGSADEAANEPSFARGDLVKVRRYGRGIVEEANTLQITVAFSDGTRRCFQLEYVAHERAARRARAAPANQQMAQQAA